MYVRVWLAHAYEVYCTWSTYVAGRYYEASKRETVEQMICFGGPVPSRAGKDLPFET